MFKETGGLSMKRNLQILYEDPHIIVCFKPHGIATQSRKPGQPDMEHMILNHIASSSHKPASKNADHPYLAVIHRLDQPVSGILVFAKTPEAARNLNRQLTAGSFCKQYLALVEGIPAKEQETLTDYMIKDGRTNTSRICGKDTPGAKQARLSYRVLSNQNTVYAGIFLQDTAKSAEHIDSCALLEVTLDTGRHHQIRVQLAHMGCPIVGDTKYNSKTHSAKGWQTIHLCAYKLTFQHPVSKKAMDFVSGHPAS